MISLTHESRNEFSFGIQNKNPMSLTKIIIGSTSHPLRVARSGHCSGKEALPPDAQIARQGARPTADKQASM